MSAVPGNRWLPEKTWKLMLASMPIPCVDAICVNDKGEILFGWRVIAPYKYCWALPGGRILRGEDPLVAVRRHLRTYGIKAKKLRQLGTFSSNFGWRCDVSTAYVVNVLSGPTKTRQEFSWFEWKKDIPKNRLAGVYRKMFRALHGEAS
jgi:ADP-ribose pyrophosphatase YjhB (NUDIX family)